MLNWVCVRYSFRFQNLDEGRHSSKLPDNILGFERIQVNLYLFIYKSAWSNPDIQMVYLVVVELLPQGVVQVVVSGEYVQVVGL